MTEKKRKILDAALRLFANDGFSATSTNKVAKAAGVSEGLIFRHFGNKEGLLDALLNRAREMAQRQFGDLVLTKEPKDIIRKALELPFMVSRADYEVWRLTYALKWQTNRYETSATDPVKLVIKEAFSQLGYQNPEAETDLLFMFLDGAATSLLLHETDNHQAVLTALKRKYNL